MTLIEALKGLVEAAGDILPPRTTKVEKIIDKIDLIYSKVNSQTGDVSWVDALLDKHNAGDDNGPEGYFTAMSNEDILACWSDIKEVLCQKFKQKLDDPEVNLYDFFRFL